MRLPSDVKTKHRKRGRASLRRNRDRHRSRVTGRKGPIARIVRVNVVGAAWQTIPGTGDGARIERKGGHSRAPEVVRLVTSETSPVGTPAPLVGATAMFTFTSAPWVKVVGLSAKVVVVAVNAIELH